MCRSEASPDSGRGLSACALCTGFRAQALPLTRLGGCHRDAPRCSETVSDSRDDRDGVSGRLAQRPQAGSDSVPAGRVASAERSTAGSCTRHGDFSWRESTSTRPHQIRLLAGTASRPWVGRRADQVDLRAHSPLITGLANLCRFPLLGRDHSDPGASAPPGEGRGGVTSRLWCMRGGSGRPASAAARPVPAAR
jgi:hypothetical protein